MKRKNKTPLILAGDIGGTKSNLGLFSFSQGKLEVLAVSSYPNQGCGGIEPLLARFLSGYRGGGIGHAAFGVAGPVANGRVDATNLPWRIDAKSIARTFRWRRVELLNDLSANAWGVAALEPSDFFVLNRGSPRAIGNRALLSAGTGLGEAHLHWDGSSYRSSPSEGGHADFAPCNALQADLWKYLLARFKQVSYERVLSGPGLHNIYCFLRDERFAAEPRGLSERLRREDPGAVISASALEGRSKLCVKALDLFVEIYGAQAGNVALSAWATGGMYIGGGIAPKILRKIKEGAFMRAFLAKGRFSSAMAKIPVRIILNEKAALLGAALFAARHEK